MVQEYKFAKQILQDQGIEAKEGSEVNVRLGEETVNVRIVKIEEDQIIADRIE